MKVSMWYNNKDIRTEDVPRPEPGPGEMLVKVMSCGICGSDIVEWYRLPRAPLVPGHEIGGVVVEIGEKVDQFKPGDNVFIAPKVPCMTCRYCRNGHYPACSNVRERLPGGFAEYVLVPAPIVKYGTYRLPDHVSCDQSTFIEPLACVVRAQRLAGLSTGQSLTVMGCGMSGLMHVKLASAGGIAVTAMDINARRLKLAKTFGADRTINVSDAGTRESISEKTKKTDAVMICTSAMSAIKQAWQCVDKGGRIVFFAVPGPDEDVVIPINRFWTNEIGVLTSYYCGPPDITEAIRLLESGEIKVDDMITHILPMEDIMTGFELVLKADESVKVIIRPHG